MFKDVATDQNKLQTLKNKANFCSLVCGTLTLLKSLKMELPNIYINE